MYSKVPNKFPPPPIFFEKINPTPPHCCLEPPPPPPPLPLINFWIFKSRSKKIIEQCKMYLSIRNSIKSNEIDFSECFRFQCYS